MPSFSCYLGVDYSGAQTPLSSLPGLRLYQALTDLEPAEVQPPPGPRKYFTREGLAQWLVDALREGPPTLLGIDHGFSFPRRYFEVHQIPPDWDRFLEDFAAHWPTADRHTYVDFVRSGMCGRGGERQGNSRWRRYVEERARAKSVFHFDVPGSVAKSTHAGLPWLLQMRRQLGARVHFWPFDGWAPASGVSVVAEVYPSLWSRAFPRGNRTGDQQDAYSAARWMRERDEAGELDAFFQPELTETVRELARQEGWILGVA